MRTKRWRETQARIRRIHPPSQRAPVREDESYGVKRIRWTTLRGLWHFAHTPLPGTIEDFVKFIGAESVAWVESASFSKLEVLPNVVKKLRSTGGSFSEVKGYVWKWEPRHKEDHYPGCFVGAGRNYNQAALAGLVLWWELVTYRKKQREVVSR